MVERPLEQSGSKSLAKGGHKVYEATHLIMHTHTHHAIS